MLKKESKATLHKIGRGGGDRKNANKNETQQSIDDPKHQKEN
jgi:hypothetical protein